MFNIIPRRWTTINEYKDSGKSDIKMRLNLNHPFILVNCSSSRTGFVSNMSVIWRHLTVVATREIKKNILMSKCNTAVSPVR